jgi:hypothetical protein
MKYAAAQSEDIDDLYNFVVEMLPNAPLTRRARLCRAFALIVGSSDQARMLIHQADACDAIEQQHRQLLLDLQQRARKTANPFGK